MYRSLQPELIVQTAATLARRVAERFPESGLARVAEELASVSRLAAERSAKIARPNRLLRVCSWALSGLLAATFGAALWNALRSLGGRSFADFLQAAEAAANLTVLLGAAIVSVATLETRLKRRDALEMINELRAFAHVVDMHQLTKDPEAMGDGGRGTASSPKRELSRYELGRYLDYCSEMFSVLGKLAALYGQRAQDGVVLEAVDAVEDLTTGLSRKVWQKIALLRDERPAA